MDDDFRRPAQMVTAPVAFGPRARETGSQFVAKIRAAGKNNCNANRSENWNDFVGLHWAANANRIGWQFKESGIGQIVRISDEEIAISMPFVEAGYSANLSCLISLTLHALANRLRYRYSNR